MLNVSVVLRSWQVTGEERWTQYTLVQATVLSTSLSDKALVHGSANLCDLLLNSRSKEHPPEPPEEPRREACGLRAPPPGRCGEPEAGGPPLGRCGAASGGASGRPAPGYRSAGRDGLRRACWSWKAPGPPRGGWGSRGKRRPWDGWRGTPAPTPHRSGRARAPQALASALARAEVDGAVLVWCSPLPGSAPFC